MRNTPHPSASRSYGHLDRHGQDFGLARAQASSCTSNRRSFKALLRWLLKGSCSTASWKLLSFCLTATDASLLQYVRWGVGNAPADRQKRGRFSLDHTRSQCGHHNQEVAYPHAGHASQAPQPRIPADQALPRRGLRVRAELVKSRGYHSELMPRPHRGPLLPAATTFQATQGGAPLPDIGISPGRWSPAVRRRTKADRCGTSSSSRT